MDLSYPQSDIQSGSWSVSQSLPSYSLDKNIGERIMTIDVKFKKSFSSKPKIVLSINQIDASKEFNLRYEIEALSISRDGFVLKVKTWGDSKIFSLSGNWLACTE